MADDPRTLGFYFEDAGLFDYGYVFDEALGRIVRGPVPTQGQDYFSAIGAAHTLGRYSDDPFPARLARRLGTGVWNFGRGGVGPAHFLTNPALIERINGGRFCIIQVMGGRSITTRHARDPDDINRVESRYTRGRVSAVQTYRPMFDRDRDLFFANLKELQANYMTAFGELAAAITVPKVLVLVALEAPLRKIVRSTPLARMWKAPQFVDRAMIDAMAAQCDAACEVVSTKGLPQNLFYSGDDPAMQGLWKDRPVKENAYYPTPQIHARIERELSSAWR